MHVPLLTRRPLVRRFLFGSLLIPFVSIFAHSLFPNQEFAFRDISQYYGPYWEYIHEIWSVDGLPWWNSLEENGRPLLADATASVFYPGQFLFFLPVPFGVSLKLFIYLHVGLAALSGYLASRCLGISHESSVFAALAYAFGGSVIFQYCNPIFLVGAAWLPMGFSAIQLTVETGRARYAGALAAIMAMTVLGGNPQSAYLLVIVAAIRAACGPESTERSERKYRVRLFVLFVGASFAALMLSAVQIAPTLEWARTSERAFYDSPRSLPEFATGLALNTPGSLDGLIRPPAPDTHRSSQYDFSVGPWRWSELIWPNVSGKPFPRNERWLNAIPAEGRYWSPTLYMGLAPILLGLGALRPRSDSPNQRWLSWCVILFGLACLGEYGLAWFVNEVRLWLGLGPTEMWSPIGGVYWMMNATLPGFVMFRYPAKLWTIVALALSLLAARRLDEIREGASLRERNALLVYAAITIALLVIVIGFASSIGGSLMGVRPDLAFGPLDKSGALRGLRGSLIHGLVVATAVYLCCLKAARIRDIGIWIILITAMDIAIANAWIAPTTPTPSDADGSPFVAAIRRAQSDAETVGTFRWKVSGWYPKVWSLESDVERLSQVVRWDRQTLRPKYNLAVRLSALNSSTSFSSVQHRATLGLLNASRRNDSDQFNRLLSVLGVDYVIAPHAVTLSSPLERMSIPESTEVTRSASLWHNPSVGPRVWIVHNARAVPFPQRLSEMRRDLQQVLLSDQPGQSIRECLVLDNAKDAAVLTASGASPSEAVRESCEIMSEAPSRLVIRARLVRPGFIVLRDSYAPGWKCSVRTDDGIEESTPVLCANRIMRAVALPAGTHEVTMQYRPRSVYWGATVSASSWLMLMIGWFAIARSRRN